MIFLTTSLTQLFSLADYLSDNAQNIIEHFQQQRSAHPRRQGISANLIYTHLTHEHKPIIHNKYQSCFIPE